jgi:hypothetical protein
VWPSKVPSPDGLAVFAIEGSRMIDLAMAYELATVTTEDDWRAYHTLRRDVLWKARRLEGYDERHSDGYLAANHPPLQRTANWSNQT